jgi:hypothetical protein
MGGGFLLLTLSCPTSEAVTGPILEDSGKEDPPLLILERRAIVATRYLVTTVVAVKD